MASRVKFLFTCIFMSFTYGHRPNCCYHSVCFEIVFVTWFSTYMSCLGQDELSG